MRSYARTLVFCLSILILHIFLIFCNESKNYEEIPNCKAQYFVFNQEGYLEEVSKLESAEPKAFLAWTKQIRVSDLFEIDGKIYLLVNGKGVIQLNLNQPIKSRYFFEADFFSQMTTTRFFQTDSKIFCHLYYDYDFARDNEQKPVHPPKSLLKISFDQNTLFFLPISMSLKDDFGNYQAVYACRIAKDKVLLQWKNITAKKINFKYSVFNLNTEENTLADNMENIFRLKTLKEFPANSNLFIFLNELLEKQDLTQKAIYFHIQNLDTQLDESYFVTQSDIVKFINIFVRGEKDKATALLAEGILFSQEKAGELSTYRLPPLPPGYNYTNFWLKNDFLVASWEEQNFYQVGRSGIVTVFDKKNKIADSN